MGHIFLDGYPVLGESEKAKGLFNAILHAAVTLTPVVAQITAELITKGRSKLAVDDHRPSRYEKEVSSQNRRTGHTSVRQEPKMIIET